MIFLTKSTIKERYGVNTIYAAVSATSKEDAERKTKQRQKRQGYEVLEIETQNANR